MKLKKCLATILLIILLFTLIPVNVKAGNTTVNALKSKYPAGTFYYNSFDGGSQCAGFARLLFYEYYGQYATHMPRTYNPSASQIKPGDVIRYEGGGAYPGGHEVWVIGVTDNYFVVGECNWFQYCEISWDRWVYKNQISISYVWSAPYEINDNQRDTEKPKINDFFINTVSTTANSIKVKAKASDNVGVTRMKFRIWRSGNSDTSTKTTIIIGTDYVM